MPRASLFACAAALVGLSWLRFLVTGHPSPDHATLPHPLDLLGAILFVGAVFVVLRAHVRRAADSAGAGAGQVTTEALGLCLLAGAMLPLLSSDLYSVLAYGELSQRGVDPFTLPAPGLLRSSFFPFVSSSWREAPCTYGPVQLLVWAPAARLGASLPAALAVAKLLSVAAAVATIALLHRYCSRTRPRGLYAAAALSPVLWLEGAGQSHNDVVVGLLFAAWLLAARRRWFVLGAALLGAAVASKLTAALPAGMYLVYVASRPGSLPVRLGRASAAAVALGGAVALAYLPYWNGPDTLRVPLAFLAERRPTNSLAEIVFVAMRPIMGSAAATSALSSLGTALTAGLALAGAVLAWRAPDHARLAGAMAGVSLLAATLAAPVFHPWYLIPCLVLAVELRDRAWQAWLPRFGAVSLLADGSVLFAYGSTWREIYTILSVAAVAGASVMGLGPRLRGLLAPSERPER